VGTHRKGLPAATDRAGCALLTWWRAVDRLVHSAANRIGPSNAVASVSEKGVQRAADVCLRLVEFGAEDGVDLRGAGEPQPECDLAGSDEVIEMGEVAGLQRPMPGVALGVRMNGGTRCEITPPGSGLGISPEATTADHNLWSPESNSGSWGACHDRTGEVSRD
jgi:hypothetical protein